MGGVWNALVGGFAGMRDYLGVLSFDPRLPVAWECLTFPMTLRGNRVRVQLDRTTISFTLETGDDESVDVRVQGNLVTVTRGGAVTVGLKPAPVLQGRPSVRDIEGFVREDGSVVRATVPPHPMVEEPMEAMD